MAGQLREARAHQRHGDRLTGPVGAREDVGGEELDALDEQPHGFGR